MRKEIFISTILLSFVNLLFGQEHLSIFRVPNTDIGLESSQWASLEKYSFDGIANDFFSTSSTFELNDLMIDLKIGWNDKGLLFNVLWKDDVVDYTRITKGNAIIKDADGNRRDKMYFYDNMEIKLVNDDFIYESWWSISDLIYQWHSLRVKENDQWQSELTPRPNFEKDIDEKEVRLFVQIEWEVLGFEAPANKGINLIFVVSDSDQPEQSIDNKMSERTPYVSMTKKLLLEE
ncbi:MAG: hypothetical protein AAF693_18490 [Bacteroidota bacterium]